MARLLTTLRVLTAGLAVATFSSNMSAQVFTDVEPVESSSSESDTAELPESPGTVKFSTSSTSDGYSAWDMQQPRSVIAPKYSRTIGPGQQAEPLTGKDKLALSLHDRLRVTAFASTIFSAGWNHLNDGRPHYGTDKGAFGQRLGAATLKQTSQSILSFGVFAALFHEDPRYYVMGRQKSIGKRALYAASRVIMTRTDSGNQSVNWSNISGMAGSTALTNVYYPDRDTGFSPSMRSFGTSFATGALSNEIREFMGDAIGLIRHKK